MGRVFSIGMDNGNFAVTNIEQNAPEKKSFLSSKFGVGFDESRIYEAFSNFPTQDLKSSGMKV